MRKRFLAVLAAVLVLFVMPAQADVTLGLSTYAWAALRNLLPAGALTLATATQDQAPQPRSYTSAYSWTNAQVVALGAALTGDITMVTLPAKTVVENSYVVITGQGAGTATLTVACGTVSAAYIDLIVASDAKAASGTLYGDASAERGTNSLNYFLPSYSTTTAVKCHFISTVQTLDATTGSSGKLILVTNPVP